MSFFQALFHHLIDPMVVISGLLAGMLLLSFKMRLIVAFTIGLVIELIFVLKFFGQEVSLFTLLTGSLAAYMWMVVGGRLKAVLVKYRS